MLFKIQRDGRCHLCRQDNKRLHGKSHVIPDFMFRQLKDEPDHRHLLVDFDQFAIALRNDQDYNPQTAVSTPFDNRWYCTDCENVFSRLDDFAAKFLAATEQLDLNNQANLCQMGSGWANAAIVRKHKKAWLWLKFVLSVAYRMHHSNNRYFTLVQMSPDKVESIRSILLEGEFTQSIMEMEIHTMHVLIDATDLRRCFIPPICTETQGKLTLFWCISGYWYFVGSPRPAFTFSTSVPYNKPNEIFMPMISTDSHLEWILACVGK